MFIVGITGGIGSGKTAATDRFAELGIEIIDADVAARTVVEPGTPALEAITNHFGQQILLATGELDRPTLRKTIFSNDQEKKWLESLLHPLIGQEILHGLQASRSPYTIFSSPLLFESGQESICNQVLLIDVPVALQLERTMQRDHNDEAQVKRIIDSQMQREQRLAKADDIIYNDRDLSYLYRKVDTLHHQYLQLAKEIKHD
jgi:dephospho-CoA kinase